MACKARYIHHIYGAVGVDIAEEEVVSGDERYSKGTVYTSIELRVQH